MIQLAASAALFAAAAGAVSAQTVSDPVMRTLRVAAICDGTPGSSGAIELHFHTFGSAKVGPAREVSPPPLRCTQDEPVTEAMELLAVPMIWHAFLRVPDGSSSTSVESCEVEGSDLPASSRCSGRDSTLTLEITEILEAGLADGAP